MPASNDTDDVAEAERAPLTATAEHDCREHGRSHWAQRDDAHCPFCAGEVPDPDDPEIQERVGTPVHTSTIVPDRFPMVSVTWAGLTRPVHEGIVDQFRHIIAQWEARGGQQAYRVYSWWGYARRPGGAGGHPRGVGVDVNPADNPMVPKRTPCPTNMPQWFVQLWKAQGFGWGADWRSKCDAMHFCKLPNEGGNGQIYEPPRGPIGPIIRKRVPDMVMYWHQNAVYVAYGEWRGARGLEGPWVDAYKGAGVPLLGEPGKDHPLHTLPVR